ncbi:helix-turn-helix domain-containing protein [Lentilactobacillus raoultii]|uniref:Helix-turn-helix domain-containing protein n=1 Tax=Lentilactobacillus raoultii TaxID=1987503 RepID=A0ABW3PPZ6_9LACO|nr:helix-turn-helix domain-containing protein [Lentilactobacillus raoultii]
MLDSILNKLMKTTPAEKEQLKSFEVHDDIPIDAFDPSLSEKEHAPVLNDRFFRNKRIYVSKHNRYAPYPEHSHTFFEINYMLRGSCDEVVDGEKLHLETGDVLLMDIGSRHSIGYLGTNDLLINILFRNRDINLELLNGLRSSQSVFYEFLLDRKFGSRGELRHLLFSHKQVDEVQETLDRIIDEYYLQKEFADTIISGYLSILIAQLVRNYHVKVKRPTSKSQQLVLKMLQDIDRDFQTVSLERLATKYKYNRNYLSNVFKRETGETFSEALNKQRMRNAHMLLTSTALPVTEVMKRVGISNKAFFYKKYMAYYQITPGSQR